MKYGFVGVSLECKDEGREGGKKWKERRRGRRERKEGKGRRKGGRKGGDGTNLGALKSVQQGGLAMIDVPADEHHCRITT